MDDETMSDGGRSESLGVESGRIISDGRGWSVVSRASSPRRKRREKEHAILPLILVAASFGIYLSDFGLKLEHLVIYPLLVFFLTIHATRKTWLNRISPLRVLVCLWGLLVSWFYLVTWQAAGFSDLRSIMRTTDNFIVPAAVILIITACTRKADEEAILGSLIQVCNLLSIVLAINGLLALVHSFCDISFVFQAFLPAPDAVRGTNVWDRSLQMGRYLGVFAMPFEAGITYGLGIIAWFYARRRTGTVSVLQEFAFWMMIIGGILTVSKAFILAIFMLLCFALLESRHLRSVVSWRWVTTMLLSAAGYTWFLEEWRGARFWLRLFAIQSVDLLDLFSGGRYAAGSGVLRRFGEVWAHSPLIGLGMGHPTTVDNAYLEVFWLGGMVALGVYVLIILALASPGVMSFARNVEARFVTVLACYVVVASLGAPVLTMNKFGTVFWILVSLLLTAIDLKRRARCWIGAARVRDIQPLRGVDNECV